MHRNEALWVEDMLNTLPIESLSPLLDIGSADARRRTVEQPYIDERVFAPLRRRGVRIRFVDVVDAPGVDVVADLMAPEGAARLRRLGARCVMCCNVLEHVEDAGGFALRLQGLLEPGGRLIVTVPRRHGYHPQPIDTMFRPDVSELAALFPGCGVERSAIVKSPYRGADGRSMPMKLLRHFGRLAMPFLGWRPWLVAIDRLQYLVRPYEVTCVSLVKR